MIDKAAIKHKIYQQARDLEVAIYNATFEGDSPEMAVICLTLFQNKDGGFHGIEPDLTNPNSTPFQTSVALEILTDLGINQHKLDDLSKGMIQKAFKYLEKTLKDDLWPKTIPSNNDYSCALWWKYQEDEDATYNPTASLVSSILTLGHPNSNLYKKANRIKNSLIEGYLQTEIKDKHDLMCLSRLFTYGHVKSDAFKEKLFRDVQNIIDLSSYEGYITTPLDFPLEQSNYGLSQQTLNDTVTYLEKTFKGSFWDINWTWLNQDEGFDVQSFKWHGIIAIRNLRFLRHIGK